MTTQISSGWTDPLGFPPNATAGTPDLGALPEAPPAPAPEAAADGSGATGLENLEMGAARIQVDDKQIINCRADLNQLVPFILNFS